MIVSVAVVTQLLEQSMVLAGVAVAGSTQLEERQQRGRNRCIDFDFAAVMALINLGEASMEAALSHSAPRCKWPVLIQLARSYLRVLDTNLALRY